MTKRSLIQFIPSVFDSLGLLNPVIVKLKISFLDVCCEKFALDDILPESYLTGFYDIVYDLCKVQKVLFERVHCIETIEDPIASVQVHSFCAALKVKKLCILGLFDVFISNFVKVVLVSTNRRVGPLRKITISRLELLRNLLLSQLVSSVIINLTFVYKVLTKF